MKKRMIVAAITLALTGIQAEAAKTNKDKYKDVTVYGNVTLEQDSMKEWGPWEQFIQPAADAPAPPLAAITPDPIPEIRDPIIDPVPVDDDFCKAGEWCGYTAFGDGAEGSESGPVPGLIALSIESPGPDCNNSYDCYGGDVSYRTSNPPYNSPVHTDSYDPAVRTDSDGNITYIDSMYSYQETEIEDGVYSYSMINSFWWGPGRIYPPNPYGHNGRIVRAPYAIMGYIENGVVDEYGYPSSAGGSFVAGQPTGDSAVNEYNDNIAAEFATEGMTADYYGSTYGNGNGDYSDVHIEVTFGNDASWSGEWNGGSDGNVSLETYTNGDYVSGEVGMIVTGGSFSGDDLIASGGQITADDGTIHSGTVEASFYGPQGDSIGGVANIVKTVDPEPCILSCTGSTSYVEHQHTDTFLVTDESNY